MKPSKWSRNHPAFVETQNGPRKSHVRLLKENRRLVVAAAEETLGKGAVAGGAANWRCSSIFHKTRNR